MALGVAVGGTGETGEGTDAETAVTIARAMVINRLDNFTGAIAGSVLVLTKFDLQPKDKLDKVLEHLEAKKPRKSPAPTPKEKAHVDKMEGGTVNNEVACA